MSILTKGRTEISCYNNIGGVKNVYLFKYINYSFGQIVAEKGVELTTFPSTTIYKYEGVNSSFQENIQNNDTGILYNQTVSFDLQKQNLVTTVELNKIKDIDLRYIVEFNDGSYKIGGLYNGAKITGLELTTGGSKSDFNGYKLTIESKEQYQSAYIDNLGDVGFVVSPDNYLITEDGEFILTQDNEYIIIEE